jgi:hypothetical protein
MVASFGQAPFSGALFSAALFSAAVDFTSATLPEVAAIAIVPVASGVGSAVPFVPPEACWTR